MNRINSVRLHRIDPQVVAVSTSAIHVFATHNSPKTTQSSAIVARSLAEKYRNVTAEEKERLEGLAKADKERYRGELCSSYVSEAPNFNRRIKTARN